MIEIVRRTVIAKLEVVAVLSVPSAYSCQCCCSVSRQVHDLGKYSEGMEEFAVLVAHLTRPEREVEYDVTAMANEMD